MSDLRSPARSSLRTGHPAPFPLWRAGTVLAQSRDLFADAVRQPRPAERFRFAHLAALRATAALLLAVRSPASPRPRRPASAWSVVTADAPDFADWADYFARRARQRAAADAGVPGAVSEADAAEMVDAVRTYLVLVASAVARDVAGTGEASQPELLLASLSPRRLHPPGWVAAAS